MFISSKFPKFSVFFLIFLVFSSPLLKGQESFDRSIKKNWYIQSSEKVAAAGEEISRPGFMCDGWVQTELPKTVMGALYENKVYNDIFVGRNLSKIPAGQFIKSWWYRTEFRSEKGKNRENNCLLEFDGINYRANIWLNGKLIADSNSVFGSFRRFSFDISRYVAPDGLNALAIEVFPPVPGDPTMGFVDWNPKSPDRNMGIFREVRLRETGDVLINYPFIITKLDTQNYKKAWLTVTSELKNLRDKAITGTLECRIGNIKITKPVSLAPGENKTVTLTPSEFSELIINNPKLWWTNDLGRSNLYNLKLNFIINKSVTDSRSIRFGIREVKDYINDNGHRGYMLNGRKILIRGGGWADNLFLDNSFENYRDQILYAKHMNLNTIRLEGFWGNNENLYDLCDENGILIMAGWSCQWEWPGSLGKETDKFGGIKTPEDMKLVSLSWQDQIRWLRNHPSIFVWLYGSDMTPRPELEKMYQDILKNDDPTRPFLASAAAKTSEITGRTAVKMHGPYDYVTPNYWYIDTVRGGAYGFNTETGPGPQVPPVESIKKMIPADSLWPVGDVYDYHCGGNAFNTLKRYNETMNRRMGPPANLNDYDFKAQFLNYEGMRAMLEAFGANKHNATGVIQWMYNSAWPKFWWQLYDYYLNPNGAFYGARKACEPLHILYNYGDRSVSVVNNLPGEQKGLSAEIRVLDFGLSEKFSRKIHFSIGDDSVKSLLTLPQLDGISGTYFLILKLIGKKGVISENFYCLSSKEDVLDDEKANWYVTPAKDYADFSELNSLPDVKLDIKYGFKKQEQEEITVELKNPSDKLAFMVYLRVVNEGTDESVLPVFWDDNYFSILPGEKKIVRGFFNPENLKGRKPALSVSGWNINQNKGAL